MTTEQNPLPIEDAERASRQPSREGGEARVPVSILNEAAGVLDCEGYGPLSMSLLACLATIQHAVATDQVSDVEVREAVARLIYEGPMMWAVDHALQAKGHRVWVKGGNSFAQDEARKTAEEALALIARSQPKGAGQSSGEDLLARAKAVHAKFIGDDSLADWESLDSEAVEFWKGVALAALSAAPTDNTDGLSADREVVAWRLIDLKTSTCSLSFERPDCVPGRHVVDALGFILPAPAGQDLAADPLRSALEKALAEVEYQPGDHPVVPLKHDAFVKAVRAALKDRA